MKNLVSTFALTVIASISLQAQTVDIANSSIHWIGEKVTGSHDGSISLKSAELDVKGNTITKGVFVIDMESITCKDLEDEEYNKKLVGHLKSDDFFGVATYKTAKLTITDATPFKNGKAHIKGQLTIKGKTKPIEFDAEKKGTEYKAHIEVDRSKYDIKYGSGSFFDDLGDNLIYDIFKLDIALKTK